MYNKYTISQYYKMSNSEFQDIYQKECFQNILNFLETRVRLELIEIVRRFRLKGHVLFEVRIKTTASAYAKLQKEIIENQIEYGARELFLFEIVKDIVGARVICFDDEIQNKIFEYILQIESMAIQQDGLEFYSAPFREFTLAKDNHRELSASIAKAKSILPPEREIKKKAKLSNYESLHFYIMFNSTVDGLLLHDLTTTARAWDSQGQRIRDLAERNYLKTMYENFDQDQIKLVRMIPIEIQVRTITQHLWALEEHKHVYKNQMLVETDPEQDKAIAVMKSTFTGLKFAYYNVERLRSIIRNVSRTQKMLTPIYTGSSKDINEVRFRYFGDRGKEIYEKFNYADQIFQKKRQILPPEKEETENIADLIVELFHLVQDANLPEEDQEQGEFNIPRWGQRRLFFIFLAYVALFSSSKSLPLSVARQLKTECKLVGIVGKAAYETSVANEELGTLKLASKLYERIATFDHFARTLSKNDREYTPEEAMLFWDPLVGIRLASAFFLQSEFAGARKAITDVFSLGENKDFTSWHKLQLAQDFSLSEILMRYSQYVVFESFEDDIKMLENFQELENLFEALFSLPDEGFNPEHYRSCAWYHSLTNYLFTQDALVPEGLTKFQKNCDAYLIRHQDKAKGHQISRKLEVKLAFIFLPVLINGSQNPEEEIDSAYRDFIEIIEEHISYPRTVNDYLSRIAHRLRRRALKKVGSSPNMIFLSYSAKNRTLATEVVNILRSRGLNVTYDLDFELGEVIPTLIEQTMSIARCAVLLVTPEYLKSPWAEEERAFLMNKRRKKKLKLLVVRVGVGQDDLFRKAPLLSNISSIEANRDNVEEATIKLIEIINAAFHGE